MDYPAIEPREQPLGAADRGVERYMLAGGVAVVALSAGFL
jgi:hypothetical protein